MQNLPGLNLSDAKLEKRSKIQNKDKSSNKRQKNEELEEGEFSFDTDNLSFNEPVSYTNFSSEQRSSTSTFKTFDAQNEYYGESNSVNYVRSANNNFSGGQNYFRSNNYFSASQNTYFNERERYQRNVNLHRRWLKINKNKRDSVPKFLFRVGSYNLKPLIS